MGANFVAPKSGRWREKQPVSRPSKGHGALPQSSELLKRFLKIISVSYICQLTKFGYLMSSDSKDLFKNASCLMY